MADKEHVKLLRAGVEGWNKWREKNAEVRPDFLAADLRGADLICVDLNRANLLRAKLIGADLIGANLLRANLSGAKLIGADLSGADLSRANLSDANLSRADLSGSNLSRADLSDADLSGSNLSRANLSDADLSRANLGRANLSGAKFSEAKLSGANLSGADLSAANLNRANLSGAKLLHASLRLADLSGADLFAANLSYAHLSYANLSEANLSDANLCNASLRGANLSGARCLASNFGNVSLAETLGLQAVKHSGPSTIGTDTLRRTADTLSEDPSNQGAVETFLRGAGVDEEMIGYFRLMIGSPIEFYSCFISYSHQDKDFARRMYDKLQGQGIRCWLDEKELLPGDDIYQSVDRGIRLWDKVLLCCSKDSLTSWWVENEIDTAFEKERKLRAERDGKAVLAVIPLNLDDTLFVWEDGRANKLKSRLAADFTGWEHDNAKFEDQFEKVVRALKTGEREKPPTALL